MRTLRLLPIAGACGALLAPAATAGSPNLMATRFSGVKLVKQSHMLQVGFEIAAFHYRSAPQLQAVETTNAPHALAVELPDGTRLTTPSGNDEGFALNAGVARGQYTLSFSLTPAQERTVVAAIAGKQQLSIGYQHGVESVATRAYASYYSFP